MLTRLGCAVVPMAIEVPSCTNGFAGRSKSIRKVTPRHNTEVQASPDSIRERMGLIASLRSMVHTEIDDDRRYFYEYEESRNPVTDEYYVARRYIYDPARIEAIRELEKEALEYIVQALRIEAMESLPRMRNYPGSDRLAKCGKEQFMNIGTLLGQLDDPNVVTEHTQRPKPWKALIRSLALDLQWRFENRNMKSYKKQYSAFEPDWYAYMDADRL